MKAYTPIFAVLLSMLSLQTLQAAPDAQAAKEDQFTLPRVVKQELPDYPKHVQRANVEGTVLVEAKVSPDGKVVAADALSGPCDDLSKVAEEAVRQWEFAPAEKNGQPVAVTVRVPVNFELVAPDQADTKAIETPAIAMGQ